MGSSPQGVTLVNSFALVTYLPERLGGYLDGIRRDLVDGCNLQSHVTVLPPRALLHPPEAAIESLQAAVARFEPFEIELGAVARFDVSSVVYLEIRRGVEELLAMHESLSQGVLAGEEAYPYQPHLTLAQGFPPEEIDRLAGRARDLWRAYAHPRRFLVETLAFVQATAENQWVDLADFALGRQPVPVIRTI
jgi:2'-5' RNA ligase